MGALFVIAGLIAVAGAVGVVLAKQPVHQVLATVVNFIGLAALYVSLTAEFLAVIQIIIYGGAVMVLFLFVVSLLTARKVTAEADVNRFSPQRIAGFSLGAAVLLMLGIVGLVGTTGASKLAAIDASTFGSVGHFGRELLTLHVLPFELTAFVLMVAVIGVVLLVGRQQN